MAITLSGDGIARANLAADVIDSTKLADDAVNSEHYVDASIDNAHLADDAVGVAELSATGTASSSTFLRGDNAWAAAGGGKILQVVSSTSNTATYPTGSFAAIASAEITITPSATSSKILYVFNTGGLISTSVNACALKMYRGGTTIRTIDRWGYNTNSDWTPAWWTFTYIDSPSTTSAITYSLDAKEGSSGGGWEINDTVGTGPGAMVMAMEIGA